MDADIFGKRSRSEWRIEPLVGILIVTQQGVQQGLRLSKLSIPNNWCLLTLGSKGYYRYQLLQAGLKGGDH
jgi:hypothetical protein